MLGTLGTTLFIIVLLSALLSAKLTRAANVVQLRLCEILTRHHYEATEGQGADPIIESDALVMADKCKHLECNHLKQRMKQDIVLIFACELRMRNDWVCTLTFCFVMVSC